MIGHRPIPMLAMMAKTDAAQIQVGVRNEWIKIGVRTGILIENITHAGEVALAELSRNAKLIDETGTVIQGDGLISKREYYLG